MSSDRAAKSGIALEAQRKIHSKYDENLATTILSWVEAVSGQSTGGAADAAHFLQLFKDGTLLCKLANSLQPGAIKKVNTSAMPFKQMENISFFLQWAEQHLPKHEVFQTVDLFDGQDPNSVLVCLSALARKADKFGVRGVGPKESSGEKREWTDEQLKAGQGIIGLQMGSNKGANASGINMGNSRHM